MSHTENRAGGAATPATPHRADRTGARPAATEAPRPVARVSRLHGAGAASASVPESLLDGEGV